MKPLFIALLALLAAVVVTIAATQVRVWWAGYSESNGRSASPASEQKKLEVLTSLKSSSTPSVSDEAKTLHTLSATSSQRMSDQEKLNILKALQQK
jgi:hypothetical protein